MPKTIDQPSEALKKHVFDLIARKKVGSLSAEESAELEYHLQLEHQMRLAKAVNQGNTPLAPRLVELFESINRDALYER